MSAIGTNRSGTIMAATTLSTSETRRSALAAFAGGELSLARLAG
jgi:hypothetical protein